MKKVIASTMILLLVLAPAITSASTLTNLSFGGKSGDWIEYEHDYVQNASAYSTGEMEKIEFLNVSAANVTVDMTVYTPTNMVEWDNTTTFDLATQVDVSLPAILFSPRVYFIPGGLSVGDSVYLGASLGPRNITGETSRSYGGVSRTVIYANFSDAEGSNYILYWDKQTGVLTEGWKTFGVVSEGVMFSATNMWGTELGLLLWIAIIGAIGLGVLSSRKNIVKKLHKKADAERSSLKNQYLPSIFQKRENNRTARFI
jgi:hypothetical protein